MEVNIIFQNESKIDENNNFDVEFKNNQEIIELFFNQKRDYYLTNAIAFIRNNYDQKIKDLEDLAKKHKRKRTKRIQTSLSRRYWHRLWQQQSTWKIFLKISI